MEPEKRWKRVKHVLRIGLLILFLLFAGLTVWGGARYWTERGQLDRDAELQEQLSAPAATSAVLPDRPLPSPEPEGTEPPLLSRFDGVRRQCPPFAGWLALPGEDGLSRAVVQGEDNDFYLAHNYLGEESVAGELFLDANCDRENSRNRIVYGHRMKNGRMFSALVPYADEAYTREHPDFYYSDGRREYRCTIFAVRRLKPTDPALFQTDFDSEAAFSAYVDQARSEALYPLDVEVGEEDQLILLYTCDYTFQDARLLIHAVMQPVEEGDPWLENVSLPES